MNIKFFFASSILALMAITLLSCDKEEVIEPEISVYEWCFTDKEGLTCSSSDVLYWMERMDISPTVYVENGRLWVNGSEDNKRVQDSIDHFIAYCNEIVKDFGTFSCRKYTSDSDLSLNPKAAVHTSLNKIVVSDEELHELLERVSRIAQKYEIDNVMLMALYEKYFQRFNPVTVENVLMASISTLAWIYTTARHQGPGKQLILIHCFEYTFELTYIMLKFCLIKQFLNG